MAAKKEAKATTTAEAVKVSAPAAVEDTTKKKAAVSVEAPAEKAEEKKAPAKRGRKPKAVKAEPVKAGETKAPAKRGRKAKAEPTAKAAKSAKVYVQFAGKEVETASLVDQVTAQWVAMGHRAGNIRSLDIYVKPEDYAAYYVINGKAMGKIGL